MSAQKPLSPEHEVIQLRQLLADRDEALRQLRMAFDAKNETIEAMERQRLEAEFLHNQQAAELTSQLAAARQQLELITSSKGWHWLQRIWRLKRSFNGSSSRVFAKEPPLLPSPPPPPDSGPKQEMTSAPAPRYLEDSLAFPLRDILPLMQQRIMHGTTYWGVPALKNPNDFWVYQEIIFEMQPDVIIEIGNYDGGSTLALGHLCDLLGKGRVLALDLSHCHVAETAHAHPRITWLEGDACDLYAQVMETISPNDRVLVIEDSAHTYENTLRVLRTYSGLIRPGDYFIVEDSNCHHGLSVGPFPGPYEAIEEFLRENNDFICDREKEGFLITWNPKGFLKRIK